MTVHHLAQELEQQQREDQLFDEWFKHSTRDPKRYLDLLEYLLNNEALTLIDICNRSSQQLSCFVNRICFHFLHNLNIDRTFRADLHSHLVRLIKIIESAGDASVISLYLQNFFFKNQDRSGEVETPTPYEYLKITLKKYENVGKGLVEPSWKEKQKFGQRLARYPHLYKHCMTGRTNTNFKQVSHERQLEYIKRYTAGLYSYLRQETLKDRNPDLSVGFVMPTGKTEKENPTRLDKNELYTSVLYFKETPKQLKTNATQITTQYTTHNLLECKLRLHQTIIDLFPDSYKHAYVGQKLLQALKMQAMEYNNHRSEAVLIQQVIDFVFKLLIIDENRNHYFFIDLISNLGINRTIDILFQLIYCYPLKPEEREKKIIKVLHTLEERLAVIFQHYRDYEEEEMKWLIRFFENFNVATALHFDGLDLTGIELSQQAS